jgi:hypothetical protein
MTEATPGGLPPDKVAELQQKLAAASAEVAKVQAELEAAGGPPTTVPAVPYGGPQSPAVTVEGQQVLVNGQPVAPGQQVDLSTYLSPEVAEQVHASLSQLGLSGQLGGLFGATPGLTAPASPTTVERLADPPREVPFAFRLATFNWNWWEVFGIFLVAIAPIAIWGEFPELIPYALVAGLAIIAFFRMRKYVRRVGLLKWGKVATVTNAAELARGTYYSGTTYSNIFLRQANGWDVTSSLYSGPGSTSRIDYTLDGTNGSIKHRGLHYNNGVVLADSRNPERAMVVNQFPYSVKPDADGQYVGVLSPWVWGGVIATLVLEATLVYVAVEAVREYWLG